jgi:hypothetical protein
MTKENKLKKIKEMVETAYLSLEEARRILTEMIGPSQDIAPELEIKAKSEGKIVQKEGGRIIEGVFDGQNMVGPDGKQYSVPANYASKSKLVEGDVLKLTITPDGSFIYKQIGPIERKRMVGTLVKDEKTEEYRVLADGKSYKVLRASVTYFKGEPGDEVVILVPKEKEASWAAVENIIKGLSLGG